MKKEAIRVGFDFDGVIAYNPLRTLRLPFMTVSRFLSREKKKDIHFPYPKSKLVKWMWEQAHKTSFFPSPGFSELKELLRRKKIKGYVITGRYSFLNDELYDWLRRNKIDNLFEKIYVNMKDEQPHLFKDKMIKRLNLDYFVEDNWDIVQYLNSKVKTQRSKPQRKIQNSSVEIHWIYNIVDRFRPYKHKHPYLGKFLEEIKKKIA